MYVQCSRRVSFDLSHNVVYLLPSFEDCKAAAKERSREEWRRRSLNEEMLNEDIIAEIQDEWSSGSSDEESEGIVIPIIKSCLKKPSTVTQDTPVKTNKKKKCQHKKRKRAF